MISLMFIKSYQVIDEETCVSDVQAAGSRHTLHAMDNPVVSSSTEDSHALARQHATLREHATFHSTLNTTITRFSADRDFSQHSEHRYNTLQRGQGEGETRVLEWSSETGAYA